MICNVEVWRAVDNFPLYEVSNFGQVRSWNACGTGLADKPRIMRCKTTSQSRHLHVGIRKNNKTHYFSVHKLVLEAFVAMRPEGMECCHNDGNPRNNRVENLRWDTTESNQRDRRRHGTDNGGERNGHAKLTEDEVKEIIQLGKTGKYLYRTLAAKFNVSRMTVSRVIQGKTWKHIPR